MKIACNYCGAWHDLDETSAGRTVRCASCGKSFVAPEELAVTGQRHQLGPFPVASLVLLHYITAGAFTMMYLNLMHERMPRLRRDDPSATVAIGLCFIPIFNLYWLPFSFVRLCVRINEQRRFAGMEPTAPSWLAIPTGALFACGLDGDFFHQCRLSSFGARWARSRFPSSPAWCSIRSMSCAKRRSPPARPWPDQTDVSRRPQT
jgi:predicted Zn finger-like uncharacterized protein